MIYMKQVKRVHSRYHLKRTRASALLVCSCCQVQCYAQSDKSRHIVARRFRVAKFVLVLVRFGAPRALFEHFRHNPSRSHSSCIQHDVRAEARWSAY